MYDVPFATLINACMALINAWPMIVLNYGASSSQLKSWGLFLTLPLCIATVLHSGLSIHTHKVRSYITNCIY